MIILSQNLNNVGLGITIFAICLFISILLGKSLSKAVTWTGLGSIDKIFGLMFGIERLYSGCLRFSILVVYPYKNWGIPVEEAKTFSIVKK